MSAESWRKAHYPVPAEQMLDADDTTLVRAAWQKWLGALPTNCKKHGVIYENHTIKLWGRGRAHRSTVLCFNSDTCPLCLVYSQHAVAIDGPVERCPIYRFTGGQCAVYWDSANDPMPMIRQLKRTLDWLKGSNP